LAETVVESTQTSDALPTFQEAFAAAKAEHAEPEAAPAPEAVDETPADPAPSGDDDETLVSDQDYKALQEKHGGDVEQVRKDLERAFTKKTQKLAERAKKYDRYDQYAPVLEEYEADPVAALTKLAEQHGLRLTDATAPETRQATEEATEAAQPAVDALIQQFKEKLGPEYEYLADGLAPAVMHLVESLTKQTVDTATAPLKAEQQARLAQQAEQQTADVMKAFGEKHADWKEHEPAMLALAEKIHPNGMNEAEYLDLLYQVVTRDRAVADAAKSAIVKMTEAAKKAEPRVEPTGDSKVKKSRPKNASFADAYEAAKRGEVWED
jgi:hypothetical protein